MLDLEKEEFLKRLDIRITAISSILAYHEKHIVLGILGETTSGEFEKQYKNIDEAQLAFINYIQDADEKMKKLYEEARAKLEEQL